MTHKFEITPNKLEEIVTRHIELMKKDGFIPNLVVGVSLGGSIIGSIFSKKIGCDFSIDYRKNRRKYGLRSVEIKPEHLKILIVEDIADSMQSLFCTTKDILKEIYGSLVEETFKKWLNFTQAKSKEEYKRKLMEDFPKYRIAWFALIYDPEQSQLYPDYSEYPSKISDLSELWKVPKPETISAYKRCDHSWREKVLELFQDELLTDEVKNMPKFYTKCPFSEEQLKENKDYGIRYCIVNLKLFLGDNTVTKDEFLKKCEEEGLTRYDWGDGIYTGYNGEYYYFDVGLKEDCLSLASKKQNHYRSFGEREGLMCAECQIKPPPEVDFCITCNHYIRTIEILQIILHPFRVIDCSMEIILDNNKKLIFDKTKILEDLVKLEEK